MAFFAFSVALPLTAASNTHQSRRYFVTPLVITRDARNVKYMLKTKFESFVKGETFHTIGHDLLGLGVVGGLNFPW